MSVWHALAAAWMALIFAVSQAPGAAGSETARYFGSWNGLVRLTAHIMEFGVLAGLWYRALRAGGRRLSPGRAAVVFLLTVLYAISDEVHQLYVPNRFGRWQDVAADSIGAGLMVLGLLLLQRTRFMNRVS